ncbi:hypothetical protein [Nocardia sp. NPDC052316]|uniref:hypothetical protein n=1 Tax=Nocardia sp. NPDC052316 TaxID=3364329 RepID=UPI0037C9640D
MPQDVRLVSAGVSNGFAGRACRALVEPLLPPFTARHWGGGAAPTEERGSPGPQFTEELILIEHECRASLHSREEISMRCITSSTLAALLLPALAITVTPAHAAAGCGTNHASYDHIDFDVSYGDTMSFPALSGVGIYSENIIWGTAWPKANTGASTGWKGSWEVSSNGSSPTMTINLITDDEGKEISNPSTYILTRYKCSGSKVKEMSGTASWQDGIKTQVTIRNNWVN